MAVAVAGAVIGVNPFDSRMWRRAEVVTRELTSMFETTGAFPDETPMCAESGLTLFADARDAGCSGGRLGGDRSLAGYLRAHLHRLRPGDYFAISPICQ